jgi:hypothetical protein
MPYFELDEDDQEVEVDCGHEWDGYCAACCGCRECGNCLCDDDDFDED